MNKKIYFFSFLNKKKKNQFVKNWLRINSFFINCWFFPMLLKTSGNFTGTSRSHQIDSPLHYNPNTEIENRSIFWILIVMVEIVYIILYITIIINWNMTNMCLKMKKQIFLTVNTKRDC